MKLFPIDDVDERFMDLIGEKVRTESNTFAFLPIVPPRPKSASIFLSPMLFLASTLSSFKRVKDVIPKYDEIEVAQVNIVSYSTLANLTKQTC
jgi:hypothetical protein